MNSVTRSQRWTPILDCKLFFPNGKRLPLFVTSSVTIIFYSKRTCVFSLWLYYYSYSALCSDVWRVFNCDCNIFYVKINWWLMFWIWTIDCFMFYDFFLQNFLLFYSRKRDVPIKAEFDANLPDVKWASDTIIGHQYSVPINQTFVDTNDMGCEQMIDFPTRLENTLDIFCSNRPTLIDYCVPFPGFNNHDMVLLDTGIIPKRQKPVSRWIYLWKRADKTAVKRELDEFSDNFNSNDTSTLVNTLWSFFKLKCVETLDAFVPSKMTSTRPSQPWCNRQVKRQARRNKKAYKRAIASKLQKDWTRYKEIQRDPPDHMQRRQKLIRQRHGQWQRLKQ